MKKSEQLNKIMPCFRGKCSALGAEICTAKEQLISDTVRQNYTILISYCSVAHRITTNFLLPQHSNCPFSF